MHILLFGKNGQVGWELQRALAPLGRITAVDFDSTDYCGDFSNPAGVAETVRLVKPDVIVNAAAHTAVDKAENEGNLPSCSTQPALLLSPKKRKHWEPGWCTTPPTMCSMAAVSALGLKPMRRHRSMSTARPS